jgi:hypothetical protein
MIPLNSDEGPADEPVDPSFRTMVRVVHFSPLRDIPSGEPLKRNPSQSQRPTREATIATQAGRPADVLAASSLEVGSIPAVEAATLEAG